MGWQITGRARVNPEAPKAFAVCDRCQFLYNRDHLSWQYEWRSQRIFNRKILVCHDCLDKLQEQKRRIVIPADPEPIKNPRPGEFGAMQLSSNPDNFNSIVPAYMGTEGSGADRFGTFSNELILTTELSSIPIATEITDTLIPNGTGDGGYTAGPDTNTSALDTLTGASS